jgi:hypothetical protein
MIVERLSWKPDPDGIRGWDAHITYYKDHRLHVQRTLGGTTWEYMVDDVESASGFGTMVEAMEAAANAAVDRVVFTHRVVFNW